MKIVHAHKYFYMRAGAERYMLGLMRMQEEAGHQVAPFSMHYSKNDPSFWSEFFVSELKTESGVGKGLNFARQFGRAFWSREAERKMDSLLETFSPDIVHVHNLYTHLSPSPLRACKKNGVPVVMTVHDYALVSANYSLWAGESSMDLDHLGILDTAKTRFIKNSYIATLGLSVIQKWHHMRRNYDKYIDKYLATSNFVKDVLVHSGFDENKIEVTSLYFDNKCEFKKKDDGSILYVGRLEKYKGVHTLIEAMKSFKDTKLKIAGTGNYEMELRDLAKGMKNVEFLGFVKGRSLFELMSLARVLVVPSIWYEPFGLVAVEAMSCGTPVIASDKGGLVDIVEDGVSGLIFKAGDIVDLKRALGEFIKSKSSAISHGDLAKQRAFKRFNPEDHNKRIMGIYEEIIKS